MRRRSSTGSTLGDVVAVEEDATRRRLDQPVDHAQHGRLAASRRADEHADLALGDLEAEIVDGKQAIGVALADRVEADHAWPLPAESGDGSVLACLV